MKKFPRKSSYRLRVFVVYLLVAIIPIGLIIGVVSDSYVSRLQDHAMDTLTIATDTLTDALDRDMAQIQAAAMSLIILKANEVEYHPSRPVEVSELRDLLTIHAYDSTLYNEIALYSSGNTYLFSNFTSYTQERFWKSTGLLVSPAEVDDLLRAGHGPVILPAEGPNAFCVLYPLGAGKTKGLIFTVPADKLSNRVQDTLGENRGYCQLTDEAGNVLLSYSSDDQLPSAAVLEACAKGKRTARDGMQTVYCAQGQSEDSGLTVSMIITGGAIHESIHSMRWKWILLVLSAVLLCLAASWVTTFINTKPIVELSRKLSHSKIREREHRTNELEHIEDSIYHLNDVATRARKQVGELSDYLTFRLLCGTIENAENANQLTQVLGTSIYADAYQVCVLDPGKNLPVGELRQKILSLLPPEISCLTRAFGDLFVCVFFCGLEDENAMDVFSEELLYSYSKGRLAFGNSYSRLEDIPLSFVEAWLAFQRQESAVTAFTYTENQARCLDSFRQQMETNDLKRILADLQRLYRDMENQVYTQEESTSICANVFHILSDSVLAGRLADKLPNAYIIVSTGSREGMLNLLAPVLRELETMRSEHIQIREEPPLVEQMKEYLVANYRNADFSLQQMAFDFRLTPAMLSRYFKNHYGRNINDYLNDMKMERAQKLLLETTLSVYEVGLELGYQGPNSFIRRFKATYGITPGEFRQEAQQEN